MQKNNNKKTIKTMVIEYNKFDTHNTHKYMTVHFLAWYRHFNRKWWG